MFTVKEIATKLTISIGTVYKAINAGDLECHRFGKSIRISAKQLSDYLECSTCKDHLPTSMTRTLKHL